MRTNKNDSTKSDIGLFRLAAGKAADLRGDASDLEKPLQTLIEAKLDPLLAIRFLASEYSTGKTHGGHIDSLGIDENECPVTLEYKCSVGENMRELLPVFHHACGRPQALHESIRSPPVRRCRLQSHQARSLLMAR